VYNGHIECVKLLIPVSNPKDRYSSALQLAARHGHTQCVELLIPVSNPKAHNSYALQEAAVHGHTQCVELLYPVSDPMVALKQLHHQWLHDYNKWGQLQEMIEAERVRNTLSAEIPTTAVKVQRKM
jgi:ankyrin repeat protein